MFGQARIVISGREGWRRPAGLCHRDRHLDTTAGRCGQLSDTGVVAPCGFGARRGPCLPGLQQDAICSLVGRQGGQQAGVDPATGRTPWRVRQAVCGACGACGASFPYPFQGGWRAQPYRPLAPRGTMCVTFCVTLFRAIARTPCFLGKTQTDRGVRFPPAPFRNRGLSFRVTSRHRTTNPLFFRRIRRVGPRFNCDTLRHTATPGDCPRPPQVCFWVCQVCC